jgi:hypothetical protein
MLAGLLSGSQAGVAAESALDVYFAAPERRQMTLSPDGLFLASVVTLPSQSYVVTMAVDQPSRRQPLFITSEDWRGVPPRMGILGWSSDSRLIVDYCGKEVRIVDADGGNAQVLPEASAVALKKEKPSDASRLSGYTEEGAPVHDRLSGLVVGVRLASPEAPRTRWLDPGLGRIQAQVESLLPGRFVEIVEWSHDRARFLLRVGAHDAPDRMFVYDSRLPRNGLAEYLRSMPDLKTSLLHRSEYFSFESEAGFLLTGFITQPNAPLRQPPPLVVLFRKQAWERVSPEFSPEAQAIAQCGFAVLELNHRGQFADVLRALDWLATRASFDRRRVCLAGLGEGARLAQRGVQLHPERFRAAAALDAPTLLPASLISALESFCLQLYNEKIKLGRLKELP